MKAFLMLGQSNMAGRGVIGTVPPIKNDKCFMLRNGRWQLMGEPVNPDRWWSTFDGISLAPSFADAYANYFNEEVGLIPCADGGTSIVEWQPGELLYDHAIAQAKLAQRTSEIIGILWHQGENDCDSFEKADNYHGLFMNVYNSVYKDLNLPETVPFIMGELGDFCRLHDNGSLIALDKVKATHKNLSEELHNVVFVSSAGLTCKEDNVHFDALACREFGVRYFNEYLKYINENNL